MKEAMKEVLASNVWIMFYAVLQSKSYHVLKISIYIIVYKTDTTENYEKCLVLSWAV